MITIDLNTLGKEPMLTHLRSLPEPDETLVAVVRGSTPVFKPQPLGNWRKLSVAESDRTSARFAPYVPFPRNRVRPQDGL